MLGGVEPAGCDERTSVPARSPWIERGSGDMIDFPDSVTRFPFLAMHRDDGGDRDRAAGRQHTA
jgi:hypothetical protein